MALGNIYWDEEGLFDEKTQLQKYHATVPLKTKFAFMQMLKLGERCSRRKCEKCKEK